MFLQRTACLWVRPNPSTASWTWRVMSTSIRRVLGEFAVLERIPIVARLADVLGPERAGIDDEEPARVQIPPGWCEGAAGFMATSTSSSSPGVVISSVPKLIWNAETPNRVPAGARISAGKSGNVARSLP